MARLSRELSRLADDLPVELDLERARPGPPDREALAALYRELGFTRLLADLEANRAAPEATPAEKTTGAAGPVAAKGARAPMLFDDAQLAPGARAERARSPAAEGGLAEPDVEIVRDLVALRALAERLAAGSERLGLDCVLEPEDAMRGALVAVTLADAPGRAWLVALCAVGEPDALEALQPLFGARDRTWVGVDLKRCAVALRHRGVSISGELRDAGVAAYVADPSLPSERPELLAKAFLGIDPPSPEESFGKGARRRPFVEVESSELASFFGARTAYALALLGRLEAELRERGQLDLYERMEVPLVGILARMEHAGVRIDENRLAELSAHIRSELDSLTRRIHDLAGEEFNIGSPQQLQRILFDKLRLTPGKRTKTGFSTDESVLEVLSAEHELPREILAHRRLAKLASTYVDALPGLVHPETGRIHCRFNQTVTATGRLSSSNPNLQNIPIRTPLGQRIRAAFVPAEGFELLSADYSQIELRIVAHLSGDRGLIDAFREGADIHVRTASQVFGVAPEEVDLELRARTKAINFGIIYGQGPFGLAQQLGISQMEAREHIRAYFERYPGVKSFLERSVAEARRRGYSETLFGRRRYLPDLRSKNRTVRAAAERMASNAVIQGTAADFIKRAMVEIQAELDRSGAPRARMILQVHDELVFEVAPRDVGALASIVEARMQGVAELSVPLEVHVGHGADWLAAH
jgi:DNA polymerase-1